MGIKTTQYPNSQTTFNNLDLFDVSAYVAPGVDFETRKYSWQTLVTELTSAIGPCLPSGTNGQILAHNSTDWVATSEMFINFSNHCIGIGTITPNYKLHVDSNITGKDTLAFFNQSKVSQSLGQIQVYFGGDLKMGIVGNTFIAGYGAIGDAYIRSDAADMNYIVRGANKVANFWVERAVAVQDTTSANAPSLQIQKDGQLMFNDMWDEGYTQGFKVQGYQANSPETQDTSVLVWINGIQFSLFAKEV